MNNRQEELANNTRWIVKEHYYGKWNSDKVVCGCRSVDDAAEIVDAFVLLHKGRPFEYSIEKITDDFIEVYDALEIDMLGEKADFRQYVKGIDCLEKV